MPLTKLHLSAIGMSIGSLLLIISVSGPEVWWSKTDSIKYGQFKAEVCFGICANVKYEDIDSGDFKDAALASGAFMVLGLICALTATLMAWARSFNLAADKITGRMILVTGFISFFFCFIGIIVWGAKVNDELDGADGHKPFGPGMALAIFGTIFVTYSAWFFSKSEGSEGAS